MAVRSGWGCARGDPVMGCVKWMKFVVGLVDLRSGEELLRA